MKRVTTFEHYLDDICLALYLPAKSKQGNKLSHLTLDEKAQNAIAKAVKAFNQEPDLQMYALTAMDVRVIAYYYYLYRYTKTQEARPYTLFKEARPDALFRVAGIEDAGIYEKHLIMISWAERCILCPGAIRYVANAIQDVRQSFESVYMIDGYLFNYLVQPNLKQQVNSGLQKGLQSHSNPVGALIDYIDKLATVYREFCNFDELPRNYFIGRVMKQFYDHLWHCVQTLEADHPLKEWVAKFELAQVDLIILILAHFKKDTYYSRTFLHAIAMNKDDHDQILDYLSNRSPLIKQEMVETPINGNLERLDDIRLKSWVSDFLESIDHRYIVNREKVKRRQARRKIEQQHREAESETETDMEE